MFLKVYFEDKPLFLTGTLSGEVSAWKNKPGTAFTEGLSDEAIDNMIHTLTSGTTTAGILYHPELEALRQRFFSRFTLIEAAGGLVRNDDAELLLIFRRGKWDLPKGKMEEGESAETCAIREVAEETGLSRIELQRPLLATFHTYRENGLLILKATHWFLFAATGHQSLQPQTEEDITAARWVNQHKLAAYTANTYQLIVDVLQSAGLITP